MDYLDLKKWKGTYVSVPESFRFLKKYKEQLIVELYSKINNTRIPILMGII